MWRRKESIWRSGIEEGENEYEEEEGTGRVEGLRGERGRGNGIEGR